MSSIALSLVTIIKMRRVALFFLAASVVIAMVQAVAFAIVSQEYRLCLFVFKRVTYWQQMNCSVAKNCDSALLSHICDTLPSAVVLDCNGTAVAGAPWPQLLSLHHLLELGDALSVEIVNAPTNATVIATVGRNHDFDRAYPYSVANWRAENAALIGSKLDVVLEHRTWNCAMQLAGHEAMLIIWYICAGVFVFCLEMAFVLSAAR